MFLHFFSVGLGLFGKHPLTLLALLGHLRLHGLFALLLSGGVTLLLAPAALDGLHILLLLVLGLRSCLFSIVLFLILLLLGPSLLLLGLGSLFLIIVCRSLFAFLRLDILLRLKFFAIRFALRSFALGGGFELGLLILHVGRGSVRRACRHLPLVRRLRRHIAFLAGRLSLLVFLLPSRPDLGQKEVLVQAACVLVGKCLWQRPGLVPPSRAAVCLPLLLLTLLLEARHGDAARHTDALVGTELAKPYPGRRAVGALPIRILEGSVEHLHGRPLRRALFFFLRSLVRRAEADGAVPVERPHIGGCLQRVSGGVLSDQFGQAAPLLVHSPRAGAWHATVHASPAMSFRKSSLDSSAKRLFLGVLCRGCLLPGLLATAKWALALVFSTLVRARRLVLALDLVLVPLLLPDAHRGILTALCIVLYVRVCLHDDLERALRFIFFEAVLLQRLGLIAVFAGLAEGLVYGRAS
mmetsp:Transcript_73429/g.238791  ORF Transcript_73429/g.238791 Transcript_73429/m.238791 type:complete len:467 (-) Transcript_73429:897-2297(-)